MLTQVVNVNLVDVAFREAGDRSGPPNWSPREDTTPSGSAEWPSKL